MCHHQALLCLNGRFLVATFAQVTSAYLCFFATFTDFFGLTCTPVPCWQSGDAAIWLHLPDHLMRVVHGAPLLFFGACHISPSCTLHTFLHTAWACSNLFANSTHVCTLHGHSWTCLHTPHMFAHCMGILERIFAHSSHLHTPCKRVKPPLPVHVTSTSPCCTLLPMRVSRLLLCPK